MDDLKRMAAPKFHLLAAEISKVKEGQTLTNKLLKQIVDFKKAQQKSDNEKHSISIKVARWALSLGVMNIILYFNIDTINAIKGLL